MLVIDMPNVPAHQDLKDKVHAKACRAVEGNGLVWVYMGARGRAARLRIAGRCPHLRGSGHQGRVITER